MVNGISNAYIFVADSLRWGYLADDVDSFGSVFKTVAQSLYSPASFATLVTGLYPQQHGVTGWRKQLPDDVTTIFDFEDVSGGFYQDSGNTDDPIYAAVSEAEKTRIRDLSEPFIYMERDMTTHVPFNEYDSVREYFNAVGTNRERLQEDYAYAAKRSFERYKSRVEELEDRFGTGNTLFIYTSDHGELLGEYGDVTHTFPASPELVYVPTVITYPENNDRMEAAAEAHQIVEHVDVVETLVQRITESKFRTAGVDLLSEGRKRDWGYNHTESKRKGIDFYSADSMWWPESGYVEQTNRRIERFLLIAYMMIKSEQRSALRPNSLQYVKTYLASSHQFGEPPISIEDCQEELENIRKELGSRNVEERELTKSSRDRLEQLGYLE